MPESLPQKPPKSQDLMEAKKQNGRLVMPVTVRLNHAIADGYLVANVFRLLEQEIGVFAGL